MKKLILLALTAVMMAGCRYKFTDTPNIREVTNPVILVDDNTGDSCEYYPSYGHKGNCRFCAERRKQELKELVKELKER